MSDKTGTVRDGQEKYWMWVVEQLPPRKWVKLLFWRYFKPAKLAIWLYFMNLGMHPRVALEEAENETWQKQQKN
jgi:hypothetical protein